MQPKASISPHIHGKRARAGYSTYMYVCAHQYWLFQFLTCVCTRLRTCLPTDLIKMLNAFAHKIFQHSKEFSVYKHSGCTITPMLPDVFPP